jgi:hypothetical protein
LVPGPLAVPGIFFWHGADERPDFPSTHIHGSGPDMEQRNKSGWKRTPLGLWLMITAGIVRILITAIGLVFSRDDRRHPPA